MQRFTSKRTYTIVFFSVLFFISISLYSNINFYKQYFIDKIYSIIDFKIEFKDSSLLVFPFPGIVLHKVDIHKIQEENLIDITINKMEFLFSWKILLGIIELKSIHSNEGKLIFIRTNKFETKDTQLSNKAFDIKYLQKIFTFLNLDTITFNSIQLVYKKDAQHQEEFFFNSLSISSDHISLVSIEFDMNYQDGNFKSNTNIQYSNNIHTFESLEIDTNLKFKNFALRPFKEYYSLVYGANFDNTILNGSITIFKEKLKNEYNVKTEIDIFNLYFIGAPVYPIIKASSELTYFPELKQIKFQSIRVYYENGAIGSGYGALSFSNDIILNLNIYGEYADIYKVVYLIVRSADIKGTSNINFYSHLNIFCSRAVFDLYEFKEINLEIDIFNTTIRLKINNADVLYGHISGKGKVVANNNSSYEYDVSIKDINSELLIAKYTNNPYLKGSLSANLSFNSSGNTLDLFLDNFKSSGKIEIKKGELLGYADILKPIFSLGKLINILGPRGKNTGFQSLTFGYAIQNKKITVENLKMIGVGIDAHGGGTIGFDRRIDFRIYTGLGGLAGKALYIPIIYKGIMPDNVSYIDPVWIGSVYVGATLFGGPAGATVGGVAGSAVTEYVHKAWEGLKSIFSGE